LPAIGANPHHWSEWTQGTIAGVDCKGKCLTLQTQHTNLVVNWTTTTRQWDGEKDTARDGHPLTPTLWHKGDALRILAERDGRSYIARRIILKEPGAGPQNHLSTGE